MEGLALEDQVFGILFEYGTEAVSTLHRENHLILSANRHLEEMTGRSRASIEGSPAPELFIPDERGDRTERICARAGLHEDVRVRRLDGYPVYVSLTVAHIDHDELGPLAACIARDTTERRNLERDLIAKHTALHSAHAELGRIVDELREARKSLEERNRELAALGSQFAQAAQRAAIGEFSAGIAHSMNNPMAALSSALRQISRRVELRGDPALEGEIGRFLERSRQAVTRMESIVDAVRRAHKSGNLPSEAQDVNVSDELRTALTLFEQRLDAVRLELHTSSKATAWIPPDALHHVVSNLIDNALRALGGTGNLDLFLDEDGNDLVLRVQDDGPGLPDRVRAQLFEPFVSGRADGTGLGLSMSFRLARQWGGSLEHVESDKGTCFEIRMPRHAPQG